MLFKAKDPVTRWAKLKKVQERDIQRNKNRKVWSFGQYVGVFDQLI